ncbi:MAG: type II toxin-antitoxin system HicB family antitoxin [bacterium]|nr:type II toxin-antitoxin system HicB family antitoxin [bacterium]
MPRSFALEYWLDNDWYVGKIKEIPGVFSQGETLDELKENIRDAYRMMVRESAPTYQPSSSVQETEFELREERNSYVNW